MPEYSNYGQLRRQIDEWTPVLAVDAADVMVVLANIKGLEGCLVGHLANPSPEMARVIEAAAEAAREAQIRLTVVFEAVHDLRDAITEIVGD